MPCDQEPATAPVLVMTEEAIKEVIITSTPALAASKSEDQLMSSPDTIDGNSVPPDLKRKEKPVPHYMRASTRSCHHNCKYGTHHSPESKKNWPVLRRQLRRVSTRKHEIGKVEIMLPQRAKPRKDQKLKISHVKDGNVTAPAKPESTIPMSPQEIVLGHSESNPCVEDLPAEAPEPVNLPTDAECFVISHDDVAGFGDGESSDGAESIELEMPLAIQDSDASDENMEDGILASENGCRHGAKSLVDPVTDQSANNRASSDVRTTLPVMARAPVKHEQAGSGTKSKSLADEPLKPKAKGALGVTRNTASTEKGKRTPHPKAAVADSVSTEPKPMRARANASVPTPTKFSRQKKIGPTIISDVSKVKETKVPLPSNARETSAKPARLTKLKVSTAKDAPSSLSSEKQSDRKLTVKNVTKNAQVVQKQREEKVKPRTLKLSRSVNMPAKSISSVKVRSVKKEKIAPPIKSSKKVSVTDNSAAGAKDAKERSLKPASLKKVQKPEVNSNESQLRKEKTGTPTPRTRTPRASKPTPIPSITGTQSPRKLTFRRGKVLNPDNGSSSTPTRRLRFRRAVGATDATVRSRVGRVSGKGRSTAAAREAGTSRAEVVVLRRRQGSVNGDGKKQKQVLLNNVIEETASRLVSEARKSKVKALVGAFETVISLQEGGKAAPPAAAATTTTAQ